MHSFSFITFLVMEIVSTSTRKADRDISSDWVDLDILEIVSSNMASRKQMKRFTQSRYLVDFKLEKEGKIIFGD